MTGQMALQNLKVFQNAQAQFDLVHSVWPDFDSCNVFVFPTSLF